jgi:hypothetical protein
MTDRTGHLTHITIELPYASCPLNVKLIAALVL